MADIILVVVESRSDLVARDERTLNSSMLARRDFRTEVSSWMAWARSELSPKNLDFLVGSAMCLLSPRGEGR